MAESLSEPTPRAEPAFIATPMARSVRPWGLSLVVHTCALAALLLVPLYLGDSPRIAGFGREVFVFLPDPPPPPPLPLPLGNGSQPDRAPRKPRVPVEPPAPPTAPASDLPVVVQPPEPMPPPPEPEAEAAGVPTGNEAGVAGGMENGVLDGDPGGLPEGVPGGRPGGTGTTVPAGFGYDQPPRGLTFVRPRYPHDAFDQKVQGTVVVEFVIDVDGRVADPRVVRSVPLLDAAALEAVRQWRFVPATRRGRPVATRSRAPVSFRIL
jgi:periplasmic protein TonB